MSLTNDKAIMYDGNKTGMLHSIYHGGMVDGPGIRSVFFFAGCPLRCQYCHNPDTWDIKAGQEYTVERLIERALTYKSFHEASGGGITATGGEPFMQPSFLIELLKAAKAHGIHTTIDTSGFTNAKTAKEVLSYTDLILLDIKAYTPKTYELVTGVPIDNMLEVLRIANEMKVPIWARYVVVPGLTDNIQDLHDLAEFLRGYKSIQKVEVLPFHKAGEYKWKEIDIPYKLTNTPPPIPSFMAEAKEIFAEWNLSKKS